MRLFDRGGSCTLKPELELGKVYYLRFEILEYSARTQMPEGQQPRVLLYFGITDPDSRRYNPGWFEDDYTEPSWQQGDQMVFKVDLVNNTLHMRCPRFAQEYTAAIKYPALPFCVQMHANGIAQAYIVVKLLPVLADQRF